jgi:hypothetical protein
MVIVALFHPRGRADPLRMRRHRVAGVPTRYLI